MKLLDELLSNRYLSPFVAIVIAPILLIAVTIAIFTDKDSLTRRSIRAIRNK